MVPIFGQCKPSCPRRPQEVLNESLAYQWFSNLCCCWRTFARNDLTAHQQLYGNLASVFCKGFHSLPAAVANGSKRSTAVHPLSFRDATNTIPRKTLLIVLLKSSQRTMLLLGIRAGLATHKAQRCNITETLHQVGVLLARMQKTIWAFAITLPKQPAERHGFWRLSFHSKLKKQASSLIGVPRLFAGPRLVCLTPLGVMPAWSAWTQLPHVNFIRLGKILPRLVSQ